MNVKFFCGYWDKMVNSVKWNLKQLAKNIKGGHPCENKMNWGVYMQIVILDGKNKAISYICKDSVYMWKKREKNMREVRKDEIQGEILWYRACNVLWFRMLNIEDACSKVEVIDKYVMENWFKVLVSLVGLTNEG